MISFNNDRRLDVNLDRVQGIDGLDSLRGVKHAVDPFCLTFLVIGLCSNLCSSFVYPAGSPLEPPAERPASSPS